jgi:hypothetical protein
MDVVIVRARCSRHKHGFGLRFEKSTGDAWTLTWGFPLTEARAGKEGYGIRQIDGSFEAASTYPGCPHCASPTIFGCGRCGGMTCWDGETRSVTCAWCGHDGEIRGALTSVRSANDA